MVESMGDLKEAFYLNTEPRTNVLCFVTRENSKWVAYSLESGISQEELCRGVGMRNANDLEPRYLQGPIDPHKYLLDHTNCLEEFIHSKLKQSAESEEKTTS
jgi:hypothetical protein